MHAWWAGLSIEQGPGFYTYYSILHIYITSTVKFYGLAN